MLDLGNYRSKEKARLQKANMPTLKKPKQLQPSKKMADEAKQMEEKLIKLKQFVEVEKDKDEKRLIEKKTKSRFEKQNAPIRQYGKYVLVDQKVMDEASKLFKPKGQKAYEQKLKEQKINKEKLENKPCEITEFFNKLGLDKYKSTFMLSGFNTIEKINTITENELEQMGVLPGHQIKLMKTIRKNNPNSKNQEAVHANNMLTNNYLKESKRERLDENVNKSGDSKDNSYSFLDNDKKINKNLEQENVKNGEATPVTHIRSQSHSNSSINNENYPVNNKKKFVETDRTSSGTFNVDCRKNRNSERIISQPSEHQDDSDKNSCGQNKSKNSPFKQVPTGNRSVPEIVPNEISQNYQDLGDTKNIENNLNEFEGELQTKNGEITNRSNNINMNTTSKFRYAPNKVPSENNENIANKSIQGNTSNNMNSSSYTAFKYGLNLKNNENKNVKTSRSNNPLMNSSSSSTSFNSKTNMLKPISVDLKNMMKIKSPNETGSFGLRKSSRKSITISRDNSMQNIDNNNLTTPNLNDNMNSNYMDSQGITPEKIDICPEISEQKIQIGKYSISQGRFEPVKKSLNIQKRPPVNPNAKQSITTPRINSQKNIVTSKKVTVKEDFACGTEDLESQIKENSKRCYTCQKKFDIKDVIVHPIIDDKEFCSKECLKIEVRAVTIPCCNCKRLIIRPDGQKKANSWFCKDECWENSEEKKAFDKEVKYLQDNKSSSQGDEQVDSLECNKQFGYTEKSDEFSQTVNNKNFEQPNIEELEDLGFDMASSCYDFGQNQKVDSQNFQTVINEQLDLYDKETYIQKASSQECDVNFGSQVYFDKEDHVV